MQSLGSFNPRANARLEKGKSLQLFMDTHQQQAITAFGYRNAVGIEH